MSCCAILQYKLQREPVRAQLGVDGVVEHDDVLFLDEAWVEWSEPWSGFSKAYSWGRGNLASGEELRQASQGLIPRGSLLC